MVKRCAWGTCNSDTRYRDKDYMEGVEFFPIPKQKTRLEECKRWVRACGKKNFTVNNVNKHSYVCSKHFVDGKPTKKYPYPVVAGSKETVTPCRNPPSRRKLAYKQPDSSCDIPEPSEFIEISSSTADVADNEGQCQDQNYAGDDHDYTRRVQMVDQGTQTTITLQELEKYSDENLMNEGSMRRKFIMEDVFKNTTSCKFYTGVTLAVFTFLLNFLAKKAETMTYWNSSNTSEVRKETPRKGPKRMLSLKEELVASLLRLRRGFDIESLSNMFGVSDSSLSRIFVTWVCLISKELSFLIRWPTKEQVRFKRPACFKYFPNTRCIIDCTEFFVQKPTLPSSQRITYSTYKHHNTFKCLVGITPKGTFCFISNLFTGSISDKKIVEMSGFLNKVERGDDIMADRGFLIRGELALKGATLNIPPFSMGKQMSSMATTKTRRIASARIHVERAIGRLKNFGILQGTLPLRCISHLDEVVQACAILCNLDQQLVK